MQLQVADVPDSKGKTLVAHQMMILFECSLP